MGKRKISNPNTEKTAAMLSDFFETGFFLHIIIYVKSNYYQKPLAHSLFHFIMEKDVLLSESNTIK